jgi:hypothetical protein
MVTPETFREVVRSLPEAVERETWGHPTFRVRDKMFAAMSPDGDQASVKATLSEQAALLARDPATFSIPDYVGRHGWVGVRLAGADPDELRELLVEAWRRTAPKRLVASYDAAQP